MLSFLPLNDPRMYTQPVVLVHVAKTRVCLPSCAARSVSEARVARAPVVVDMRRRARRKCARLQVEGGRAQAFVPLDAR